MRLAWDRISFLLKSRYEVNAHQDPLSTFTLRMVVEGAYLARLEASPYFRGLDQALPPRNICCHTILLVKNYPSVKVRIKDKVTFVKR